jgi:anti-anti-sigma regulatory factor
MGVSLLIMCISPPVPNEVEITGLKKSIHVGTVEAGPRLS